MCAVCCCRSSLLSFWRRRQICSVLMMNSFNNSSSNDLLFELSGVEISRIFANVNTEQSELRRYQDWKLKCKVNAVSSLPRLWKKAFPLYKRILRGCGSVAPCWLAVATPVKLRVQSCRSVWNTRPGHLKRPQTISVYTFTALGSRNPSYTTHDNCGCCGAMGIFRGPCACPPPTLR